MGPEITHVAFTDSDCIPTPGWLSGHERALQNSDMSGGAVDVTLRRRPTPAEYVDRARHLRQESYVLEEGYAATANLAVRREVLQALQFNGALRSGGDNDFGHRARALGFTLVYAPDAVVAHPARQTAAQVQTKVDRIVTGIRANPQRWTVRPVPRSPLKPRIAKQAKNDTGIGNPLWLLRVWRLQQRCDATISKAVTAIRAEQFAEVGRASSGLRIAAFVDRFPTPATYPPTPIGSFADQLDAMREAGDAVAVVSIAQGPGPSRGVPVHFLEISRRRLSGTLLALRTRVAHPVRYARFSTRARVMASELGTGVGLIEKRWLVEAAHVLRASKPQVLVAHGAWGSSAAADCVAALLKLPWVMVMHGDDLYRLRHNLPEKLASATELVTTSRYNAIYLRREITLRRPVDEIPFGVAIPETPPRAPTYDLVVAGELSSRSGIDTLIRAVEVLHYGRPSVRLEIIGDGPLRAELEALVVGLRLQSIVTFRGAMPTAAALELISRARIFCLMARIANDGDRDPMPVAIKDALALGVPVVTRNVGSIDEVMTETCGVTLDAEDVSELAEVLRVGLRLPGEDRVHLAKRARNRALEVADIRQSAKKLHEILVLATKERDRGSYVAGE